MEWFGDFLKELGTWFKIPAEAVAVLLFLLALGYARYHYHCKTLEGKGGCANIRQRLEKHGLWRDAYFGYLRRGLAWVDGKLGASAWSAESYDFTLRMAYIYPMASLFIIWMFTGQNTSGIKGFLPEDLPAMRRVLVVGGTAFSGAMFYASLISEGWRRLAYGAYAFCVAYTFGVGVAVTVAVAVAGAVAGSGAVANTFALVGAGAVGVAYVFSSVGVGVVGVAFSVVIIYLQDTMNRLSRLGLFYLLYGASMFLALGVLGHYARPMNLNQGAKTLLIFFALLPLTNSIFDWLSLAATRWLLRHVAEGKLSNTHVAAKALASLVIGVALLAGLAIACTAAVQTMNLLSQSNGGPQFLDVAGLLNRLHTAPSDPAIWWVYFTLFSTMLPTLMHVLVASASFVTWKLPDKFRQSWLAKINIAGHPDAPAYEYDPKENHPLLVGMALRLTALDAVTFIIFAIVCAILTLLGYLFLPIFAHGLLALCEWIAAALGGGSSVVIV